MRRNLIREIQVSGTQITHHQGKVEALTAYFTSLMNQTVSANWNFNLQSLYTGLPTTTTALTAPFTAVEAWTAIKGWFWAEFLQCNLVYNASSSDEVPTGVL